MVDINDVQGFILKGYADKKHSRYILLHINDKDGAIAWLQKIAAKITSGYNDADTVNINLALSYPAFAAMGFSDGDISGFSEAFSEGMTSSRRQAMLGDTGGCGPAHWEWGGASGAAEIHFMIMVFAASSSGLDLACNQIRNELADHKLTVIRQMDGIVSPDDREHFGFRDGIAQPIIGGVGADETNVHNTIATGEFILGYRNQDDVYPLSPVVESSRGDVDLLPASGSGHKDFGKNGSYLVFRQIEQHVDKFWNFMKNNTMSADGLADERESVKLAAKMMGRWPSGAPLALYPDHDPGGDNNEDKFGYGDDNAGLKCPFGSHARRSNPRDSFEGNTAEVSMSVTNKHRIVRRGRPYGVKGQGPVGLLFMCFNADISRQFEFIQKSWCNDSPGSSDPDPFTGTKDDPTNELVQNFMVPGVDANKCIPNLQRFITIKGGSYFFIPSMTAIKYLATL